MIVNFNVNCLRQYVKAPPTNYRSAECNTIRSNTHPFRALYSSASLLKDHTHFIGRIWPLSGVTCTLYIAFQGNCVLTLYLQFGQRSLVVHTKFAQNTVRVMVKVSVIVIVFCTFSLYSRSSTCEPITCCHLTCTILRLHTQSRDCVKCADCIHYYIVWNTFGRIIYSTEQGIYTALWRFEQKWEPKCPWIYL